MRRLRDFLSLVKIGIVASNSLTALAGFALAAAGKTALPWGRGALVLGGSSLLVGGSCAINNWLDRDIDSRMERTRERPTARGAMGAARALGTGFFLATAGLALLLAAGIVPAALGLAGAFVYLVAYTLWAKRRGASSSFIGALAGSVPPLIGWAAVDPRLGGPAWVLFAFLAAWQQAHVRALALMRAGEYRAAGIPMAGLASSAAGEGKVRERRARVIVLAWAAVVLPFPTLAIAMSGLALAGIPLAVALGSCALGLAWVIWGIAGLGSPRWARRMFASSLAYLVLVFCGLVVAGA